MSVTTSHLAPKNEDGLALEFLNPFAGRTKEQKRVVRVVESSLSFLSVLFVSLVKLPFQAFPPSALTFFSAAEESSSWEEEEVERKREEKELEEKETRLQERIREHKESEGIVKSKKREQNHLHLVWFSQIKLSLKSS